MNNNDHMYFFNEINEELIRRVESHMSARAQATGSPFNADVTAELEALRKQNEQIKKKMAHPWVIQLCSQTGASLAEIPKDILELNDVTKINELFFAWRKEILAKPVELPDNVKAAAKDMFNPKKSIEYKRLLESVRTTEEKMSALQAQAETQMANLLDYKRRIRSYDFRESGQDGLDMIQKIVNARWWTLAHIDAQQLVFLTPKHIQCSWKMPNLGVDMSVDMGQYTVGIQLNSGSIRVEPYEGNINVDGYYHPHVSQSNQMCWGTGQKSKDMALQEQKVDVVLEIVRQILITYNPDSPYRKLEAFARIRNPDAAKSKRVLKPAGLAWFDKQDIPPGVYIHDTREIEDGERGQLLVSVSWWVDEKYGWRDEEAPIVLIDTTGRHHLTTESTIYEWHIGGR